MHWISVEHSLPPEHKEVLIYSDGLVLRGHWRISLPCFKNGKTYKGKQSEIHWYEDCEDCANPNDRKVTHWMHLPEVPEEERWVTKEEANREMSKVVGISPEMMGYDESSKTTITASNGKRTLSPNTSDTECWNFNCDCGRNKPIMPIIRPSKASIKDYIKIVEDHINV